MKSMIINDFTGTDENLKIGVRMRNSKEDNKQIVYLSIDNGNLQLMLNREQAEVLSEMLENKLHEDLSYRELERKYYKLQNNNRGLQNKLDQYKGSSEERDFLSRVRCMA